MQWFLASLVGVIMAHLQESDLSLNQCLSHHIAILNFIWCKQKNLPSLPLRMLYVGNSLHLILSNTYIFYIYIYIHTHKLGSSSNSLVHSFTLHMYSYTFLAINYIVEDRITPLFQNIINWKYLSWMKYFGLI